MGRSRGGLTTKIHTLVDAKGLPFRFLLTPGQSHDAMAAQILLQELWPDSFVLADKAYDADWIRACIEAQETVPINPDRPIDIRAILTDTEARDDAPLALSVARKA